MIGRSRRRPRLGSQQPRPGKLSAADQRRWPDQPTAHGPHSRADQPVPHHADRPGQPVARGLHSRPDRPVPRHADRPDQPVARGPHSRADQPIPRQANRRPGRRISARRIAARVAAFLAATALAVVLVRFAAGVVSGLPFFEVDEVQVEGAVYLSSDEVRSAAGVVPATNLWESKRAWVEGIESHPLVKTVELRRRPPSTLLVRVEEVAPVALIASPLVEAVDGSGATIPVDPSNPVLDLPLIRVVGDGSPAPSHALPVLAGEMQRMEALAPEVFSVVSEAHWEDGLVTLLLGDSGPRVRYRPPLSGRRLREGIVAMNDALERFPDRPPREVDLRFDGQVVVRSGEGEGPP